MMVSKRNLLFQGLLFRFHVKFQGCKQSICWRNQPTWFGIYQPLPLKEWIIHLDDMIQVTFPQKKILQNRTYWDAKPYYHFFSGNPGDMRGSHKMNASSWWLLGVSRHPNKISRTVLRQSQIFAQHRSSHRVRKKCTLMKWCLLLSLHGVIQMDCMAGFQVSNVFTVHQTIQVPKMEESSPM